MGTSEQMTMEHSPDSIPPNPPGPNQAPGPESEADIANDARSPQPQASTTNTENSANRNAPAGASQAGAPTVPDVGQGNAQAQDQAQAQDPPDARPDSDEEEAMRQALGQEDAEQLMEQSLSESSQSNQGSTPATGEASQSTPASGQPQHDAGQSSPGSGNGHQEIHHDMRRGRISAIRGEDVFIEIMGEQKFQGLAPLDQFDRQPRLGSVMEFVVDQADESQGLMFLSREGAVSRATWQQLNRGTVVEARCIRSNKGGLELEMIGGIRAFMPASQIALGHVNDLEAMVGQKFEAMVQEIDRKSKKVLLSRRAHLEEERRRNRDKVLKELEEGQERDGTVSKVVDFGAFVDLGGVDGLVHVTDLSWQRVKKPSDVIQAGQEVKVKVLKVDRENDRIGLGIKQIEPDPWQIALDSTSVGDMVEGKVVNIRPFGAFIELRPGVEALLPTAEMSWSHIAKPEQAVQNGDSLRLAVIAVDPEQRRMTLSIKAAREDPWIGAEHKYEVGTMHQANVSSTTQFGAFVELEPGVEGLIHISELAEGRVGKVTDVVKQGDQVNVRIKDADEENRKIGLSLRSAESAQAEADAAEQAKAAKGKSKQPAQKRKRPKDLKSGLGNVDSRTGGIGLGELSLDDFK